MRYSEEGEETAELIKASEDILKAIANKDAKALAQAFNNAYMALEKEEHESENE
jgi:CHASE3 domain sensor protein